jgi:hypothetical protein
VKRNSLVILLLLLLLFLITRDNIEPYEDIHSEFDELMSNFNIIFPSKNRNAGGPQFFKYINDLELSQEDYELYNSFYCGVSGSPIDPRRDMKSNYIVVKDIGGNDIRGKYYSCCSPCVCDITKYATVDKYDKVINLGNGSSEVIQYDVLTIVDPCCDPDNIPESIDSFTCSEGKTVNGVYSNNGRLIFALFHDTRVYQDSDIDERTEIESMCSDRNSTEPDDLQGGMGDIFVKLSQTCKLNIYGEPLQPCKTTESNGSWDNNGNCSEIGGGVHQICMEVTEERKDFSIETGQTDWSEDRVGHNHCMCLGAWALYKAKDKGDNQELVCSAIPEMSLNLEYVNNWNKWNENELENQIIDGVNSLVEQCHKSKPSPYLKNKYDRLRNSYTNWPSII